MPLSEDTNPSKLQGQGLIGRDTAAPAPETIVGQEVPVCQEGTCVPLHL